MSEETLKHGYEFAKGDPNPESIHGTKESEPEATLAKHVIHFEPAEPAEESNKPSISSPAVTKQHKPISKESGEGLNLYGCDMCTAKFDTIEELQKHRGESHKGPVNI